MAGSAGRTPTQNALVRWSIHTATPVTRQDKTAAPASRPPPRRRPDRQVRLVARPPTRTQNVNSASEATTLWRYTNLCIIIIIIIIIILAHQHKAADRKTRLDIQNYGCNSNLLCYHGVVERNRISSLHSNGKALEKECCLPSSIRL